MLLPAKMPWLLKQLYPNYVWDFFLEARKTTDKVLYLTFDDGPVPEATEFVLEQLDAHNAKATFFCIGDNIEKHSDIFNRVITDGHAIGNHTQHHVEGWKTTTEHYVADTLKAQEAINSQIIRKQAEDEMLFRPPYGRIKRQQGEQLRQLGYKIIMWDVVAKDWQSEVSKEQCLKNIMDNAVNGSIIVLHDSLKALNNVKYALPRVLDHFGSKGYRFEKIGG